MIIKEKLGALFPRFVRQSIERSFGIEKDCSFVVINQYSFLFFVNCCFTTRRPRGMRHTTIGA